MVDDTENKDAIKASDHNEEKDIPKNNSVNDTDEEILEVNDEPKPDESEDQENEEQSEDLPDEDLSTILDRAYGSQSFLEENLENIAELVARRFKGYSDDEVTELVSDAGSWESILYYMYESGDSTKDMLDYIKKHNLVNDPKFTHWLKNDNNKVTAGIVKVVDAPSSTKTFNGKAALRKTMRNGQDIFRHTLFNSGFTVEIRPPTLGEYNSYFLKNKEADTSYGYQFGGNLMLFQDIYLKEIFLDFVHNLIITSNLPGYDNYNTFLENLSILDFDALCLAAAKAIYPKEFTFSHICTRGYDDDGKLCDHIEKLDINISHLAKTVFSRFTNPQLEYLNKIRKDSPITQEEYETYRKSVNLPKIIRIGNIELKLKVPSTKEYLDSGDSFIEDIRKFMKNDVAPAETLMNYIGSHQCRQLICWIDTMYVYKDSMCKEEDFSTNDKDAIKFKLDNDILVHDDLISELNIQLADYISDTKYTFACYPIFACSKCGYIPENTSGFFGVDALATFFTSARKKCLSTLSGQIILGSIYKH